MSVNKYNVYSLFTGAGGLDIGFKEVGFNIIGASDIWEESKKTMNYNFPEIPFICKDIRLLTSEEILKSTNGVKPDVIIGGPPCQGFSVMGDKNSGDPRNTLFEAYIRLVDDLRPTAFVFENVKGVKTMFQGRYLKMIANGFANLGYDIYVKILNSKDFGVAQSRERVIIVGTTKQYVFNYPKHNSESIGKLKSYKNVDEAIRDLVNLDESFPNHISLNHSDIVIERYKLIPEGGKLPPPEKLPKHIRRKNFGNTYVRLHRFQVSPTMVPGNNAFPVHPTLNRSLTPREAARIQSFPDTIFFTGSRKEQCQLVGNAVPPLMAANIALALKKHLQGEFSSNGSKTYLYLKRNDRKTIKSPLDHNNGRLNFIDLFSGAGGIGIGLEQAGFNHIFSADFDSSVAKTFRYNNPNTPFIEGDLSNKEVFKSIAERFKDTTIDLIVGGPPCQGFSMFGKRRFVNTQDYDPHSDERNRLIFTYLDYVKLFNPKWFMIENVPGIVSLDEGYFIQALLKEIDDLGYHNCEYKIINTADYGVPQKRKRFILIANRTGNIIPWPKPKYFENPEDWEKPFRSVNEVLLGLEKEDSYEKFHNHKPMNHSEEVIERFSYIEEGCKIDPEKLPEHLKYSRTGKKIKSFSKVFFRLDRNKPSHTLVPGHSAFPIHPWLNRQLTVREAARIQTFPDEIVFLGNYGEQCKQVGNAFPPLAAEVIANAIWKAHTNNWKDNDTSNLAYYSIIERNNNM